MQSGKAAGLNVRFGWKAGVELRPKKGGIAPALQCKRLSGCLAAASPPARIGRIGVRAHATASTAVADRIARIAIGDARRAAAASTAVADWIARVTVGDTGAATAATTATAYGIVRIAVGNAGATPTSASDRIGGIAIRNLRCGGRCPADDGDSAERRASHNPTQERASGYLPNFITHYTSPHGGFPQHGCQPKSAEGQPLNAVGGTARRFPVARAGEFPKLSLDRGVTTAIIAPLFAIGGVAQLMGSPR